MADNINSVFFADLNPRAAEAHTNTYYDQEARTVKSVLFSFEPHYSLTFSAPVVSSKVRYIKTLIDNTIATELNERFALLDDADTTLVLFHRKKMYELTRSRLSHAKDIINSGGYLLNDIMTARDYSSDKQRYECIFLFNYIVQACIREYLEFQARYAGYIPEDKMIPLERFYLEVLGAPVPSPAFIEQISEINNRKPVDSPASFHAEDAADDAYTVFMTEVANYNFTGLPKVAALTDQYQTRLIRHMLGEGVPYTVAMLDFLGYPTYLKTTYRMNKEQMYKHVSKALDPVAVRTIKGNFLVLNPDSNEDKDKYTSWTYDEEVEKYYKSLPHK